MRKKRSESLGLFCMGIIAAFLSAFLLSRTLPEYGQAFVVWAIIVVIVIFFAVLANVTVLDEMSNSRLQYRPRDPAFIQRVVIDAYTDEECIISGRPQDTFRNASLYEWLFSTIDPKSEWIIMDERGNDISNTRLTDYQGIAKITSTAPMDTRRPYDDAEKSECKSEINQGVKFYD